MAITPAMDLRGQDEAPRQPPANVEAEQALLGAIMFDNEAVQHLPPSLAARHFYEPFHGRLYESIRHAATIGLAFDPVLLAEEFRVDPAFRELGGIRYLADLVDRSPPGTTAPSYAQTIVELAMRRELIRLGNEIAKAADEIDLEEGGAASIISHAEASLLQMTLADARLELVSAAQASDDVDRWLDDDDSADPGVRTGLPPLDLQLGPLLGGDLILCGARPGMGKSALASHIALQVAAPRWWPTIVHGRAIEPTDFLLRQLPEPAGVIELNGEMSVGQMTRRHLSDIAHHLFGRDAPTYKAIRDRKVTIEQRAMLNHAQAVFRELPIKMLKRTGLTVAQVRSIARRQVAAWKRLGIRTGLVIVDHVGLLRPEGRVSGRYEAQMQIAIAMKELADELGCPVLALIQLSREVERRDDKRAQLSDLRDAGGWEENADTVLFPFRESYYADKEKEPDAADFLKWQEWDRRRKSKEIEVAIAKLREGEAGRPVSLWGDMGHNAIRGAAPEWSELL